MIISIYWSIYSWIESYHIFLRYRQISYRWVWESISYRIMMFHLIYTPTRTPPPPWATQSTMLTSANRSLTRRVGDVQWKHEENTSPLRNSLVMQTDCCSSCPDGPFLGEDTGCGGPGLARLHVVCSCEAIWMYCQILWNPFGLW